MADVNALFSRAEAQFRAGAHAAARADLLQLLPMVGEHVAVLHLLALSEARLGQRQAAEAAFRRALNAAPRDAQINNNFANLLKNVGDSEGALAHYTAALAANPALHAARLNRAGLLVQQGRAAEALPDIDALRRVSPDDPGLRLTGGAAMLALGQLDAAAADFDAVLAQRPEDAKALQGRARVSAQAGDDALALRLYRKAFSVAPTDPEVMLGLAEALEAKGADSGLPLLAAAVEAHPGGVAGQDALARMRAEAGELADFEAGYRRARTKMPDDAPLASGHVACLMRAERYADAIITLDQWVARAGRSPEADRFEAMLASEVGDLQRADAAFGRGGDDPALAPAHARHLLRKRDPMAAAALLEPLALADLGAVNHWAYLAIAWRMLDGPRHEWLALQPGLVGTQAIEIDLAALAEVLRGLHRSRAHPVGQSLRGGTRTRTRLFGRDIPILKEVEKGIRRGIEGHQRGMPGVDARHPLLRFRDAPLEFSGSWSVRLADGGFHVAHVHPEGVLSSAFYVVVPEARGTEGWLEVGAPPPELGLGLPPLHLIEPRPGQLALFPSTMFHGTRPFASGERMTIAFDARA
ncbi:hypothetical protein GCM10007973_29390 [Polymorphobacter multimanifer]|uniref:putative 2OG-Fe(II) oxygenase n=1 Tax=Polymorphobacter multimanifer TaxID=1070431 RepID=UPI00166B36ED|nr:putative 2OG-Fe(II) oxygenase [Polymorphobacter multimanifer]GGI91222.1 hypothetical protein GCM10007973_29390 [Polymorphobacter multimanifer]